MTLTNINQLVFSHPSVSSSSWSHGPQHARPPCPSPSPRVCPSSCTWHWSCHPAINQELLSIKKSVLKNPDAYENYIALIIASYQYRIWDLINNLVNIMWPSVYSWTGYCAPTLHQQLCQPCLEVSPGSSQTAYWLNTVQSKNTQYFTVWQSFHSQINTLKPTFYLVLHPPKVIYFKNMECSDFLWSLGLSA